MENNATTIHTIQSTGLVGFQFSSQFHSHRLNSKLYKFSPSKIANCEFLNWFCLVFWLLLLQSALFILSISFIYVYKTCIYIHLDLCTVCEFVAKRHRPLLRSLQWKKEREEKEKIRQYKQLFMCNVHQWIAIAAAIAIINCKNNNNENAETECNLMWNEKSKEHRTKGKT